MHDAPVPRLPGLDVSWASQLLDFCAQERQALAQAIQQGQAGGSQLDYVLLAGYCTDLGYVHYALGSAPGAVRAFLAEAARAYYHVFQLRGSQPAFPGTVLTLAPAMPDAPPTVLDERPAQPPGTMDYSLTNSRRGLLAMYLALLTGDALLARQIAGLVLDPADAPYLGPDSVICTPNDQHLAYALKALLLDEGPTVPRELRQIGAPPEPLHWQALLVRAVAMRDATLFLQGLDGLLTWHQAEATRPENRKRLDLFLSVPGLGLAAYALAIHLLQPAQLPAANLYVPLALLP